MHDDPAPSRDIPVTVYIANPAEIAVGRGRDQPAAWLDAQEAARADRFRFDHDRAAFVAAHGLTRAALSRHTSGAVEPAAWRFDTGPFGKPRIVRPAGMPDTRFSLSHTASCVAVALCDGREVGVDVEGVAPATATFALAQSFCTAAELAELAALADRPAAMAERFFRLWTLKESVVKALGRGLSRAPACAGFSLDPLGLVHLDEDLRRAGVWHLWSGRLPSGHAFALAAILPPGERPRLTAYTIRDAGALAAGAAPAPLPLAVSSCSSQSCVRPTGVA